MLDKSLPKISVLMVKPDVHTYPHFELPEGFTFSGYRLGMEEDWARIQYGVFQMDTLEQARAVFARDFLSCPELLKKQCLFAIATDGKAAATASLWPGKDFGETHWRIHRVACLPEYQGYGLMKALLSKLLDIYNEINNDGFLYLTTKTHSYKAINIYKKMGFEPYLGEKPEGWPVENYEVANPTAWKMIDERIKAYQSGEKVFSIRDATEADARAFAYIICESWKAAYVDIISPEEMAARADIEKRTVKFQSILSERKGQYYLAFNGETPCGLCTSRSSRDADLPDFGEVVSLYTLKEYWSTGVGKMLMDTALAELKRLGYKKVLLWAFEQNARARRFYEKYGFVFDCTYKDSDFADKEATREVRYRIDLT
ncbi:MAG TPA: GNAT family N-acetyltransferase [Oscillospiraceae bacterium]|nr:GNAT family N-acetyltransferase [Oscillospiraceae bacterium]HPS35893.1 GNAT family N-acetyltransferase [Oscillospiraceae bacterium]